MFEYVGTANFVLLSLWFLLSIAIAALRRPLTRVLQRLHPAQATVLLLIILSLPAVISFATTGLLYLPLPVEPLIDHHCHNTNCANHSPLGILPLLGPASLVFSAVAALFIAWRSWRSTRANWRCNRDIKMLCKPREGYWELPDPGTMAFTVGLVHPRIVLSSGLLAQCNAAETDIVLRHEQGHIRQRDNLRILLARMVSLPMPGAAYFLQALSLSIEKQCDLLATQKHSRCDVAKCIVKLAQSPCKVPTQASAFVSEAVELRVLALLNPTPQRVPVRYAALALTAILTAVALCIDPLHHLVENLLNVFG